jgi:MmgE/PrpD N-terminal domain
MTGSEMVTGSSAMTIVERLARFAARASYDDLSKAAREQLKIRVLDALACAIGALDGEPVRLVRAQNDHPLHGHALRRKGATIRAAVAGWRSPKGGLMKRAKRRLRSGPVPSSNGNPNSSFP